MNDDRRLWFEPLVATLSHPALRYAQILVLNNDIAQEIVQEAFARVWASPNTPSAERDFRRWLYRTIANLANDYHRHRARGASLPIPRLIALDPTEQVEQRDQRRVLLEAVKRLSPKARQAIYLRYFEDRSVAETARILAMPQVSVRVIVHRALAKLRRGMVAPRPDEVAV
jgi:RNA polymerase sigma-70 factor, ECF subfamily